MHSFLNFLFSIEVKSGQCEITFGPVSEMVVVESIQRKMVIIGSASTLSLDRREDMTL